MRLGEIFLRANLINARQLEEALNYSGFKQIPVGRALRTLHHISEDDLSRGIEAQEANRRGLDVPHTLRIFKIACESGRTFNFVLENSPVAAREIPRALVEHILKKDVYRPGFPTYSHLQTLKSRRESAAPPSASTLGLPNAPKMAASEAPTHSVSSPPIPALPSGDSRPTVAKKLDGAPGAVPPAVDIFPQLIEKGDSAFSVDDIEAAEKAYLEARADAEATQFSKPGNLAMALTKLANLYLSTERLDQAKPLYERVLEYHMKTAGPGSPQVTRAYEDLAELFEMQSKCSDAKRCVQAAVKNIMQEQALNLDVAAWLLKRSMRIYQKEPEKTDRNRLGELAIDAQLVTPQQMQAAYSSSKQSGNALGTVLRSMNLLDAQQVESLMYAQLLVKEGRLPAPAAVHGIMMATVHRIPVRQICEAAKITAAAQDADDQYSELVLEQEKLLSAEARLGADHPEVAAIAANVADIFGARNDRASAERLYKRAFNVLEKQSSGDRSFAIAVAEKLSALLSSSGRHAEAQPYLLKALEFLQTSGKGETKQAADTLWNLARIELSDYNYATALSFLRMARVIFEKLAAGGSPPALLEEIARCSLETGVTADLEPILKQIVDKARADERLLNPETAIFMESLGDVYLSSGRLAEAEVQFQDAVRIYERESMQAKAEALMKKLARASQK